MKENRQQIVFILYGQNIENESFHPTKQNLQKSCMSRSSFQAALIDHRCTKSKKNLFGGRPVLRSSLLANLYNCRFSPFSFRDIQGSISLIVRNFLDAFLFFRSFKSPHEWSLSTPFFIFFLCVFVNIVFLCNEDSNYFILFSKLNYY